MVEQCDRESLYIDLESAGQDASEAADIVSHRSPEEFPEALAKARAALHRLEQTIPWMEADPRFNVDEGRRSP